MNIKHFLTLLFVTLLFGMTTSLNAAEQKKANIVCFVKFADETDETMFVDQPFSYYEQMFNGNTEGTQSVYNYFKHSSYGQLEWTTSFYPTPGEGSKIMSYTASQPRGFYQEKSSINPDGYDDATAMAARERALVKEIINYLDQNLPENTIVDADNDGMTDNLTFVLSSCSDIASRYMLWPHRSDLVSANNEFMIHGKKVVGYLLVFDEARQFTSPTTLGVICHEMSHSLGTYDLYHVNDKKNPVGVWDLMSDNQNVPQQMTVYTKYRYCKWVDDIPEISTSGTYTLNPVGGTTSNNIAYKIKPVGSDEYFVLEYRKKEGYDSSIPASGLIIYRINPKYSGGNVGYNGTTRLDEQYIFRPGGSTTSDGNISQANFSQESGRTSFGGLATEKPFYSDGTTANFAIANISSCGETLSFELLETSKQLILSTANLTLKGQKNSAATLTVASDEDWTITDIPTWLTVTPATGEAGTTTVSIVANSENATGSARQAALTVKAISDETLTKTFIVTQENAASNIILFDDFENTDNPNGWEISYEGEVDRGWQYTTGSTSGKLTNMTNSGTHAMTLKEAFYEEIHMDAKLTSKEFANGTTLTFYSHCNGGNATPKVAPVYIIEVSSDGGNTWNTIFDVLKDYPRDEQGNTVKVLTYTKITLDLTPYQSEHMKIRFNCYDTNNEGLQYWWQIDDIEISGAADASGITLSPITHQSAPTYDLQGRRLSKKPSKGAYVSNGKIYLR